MQTSFDEAQIFYQGDQLLKLLKICWENASFFKTQQG